MHVTLHPTFLGYFVNMLVGLTTLVVGYQLNVRFNMVTDRAVGIALIAYAAVVYVLARYVGINWYTIWGSNVPLSTARYFLFAFFAFGLFYLVKSFRKGGTKGMPNQSPEPVPAAGTPPAGQESRHA